MAIKTHIFLFGMTIALLSSCISNKNNHEEKATLANIDSLINIYLQKRRIEPKASISVSENHFTFSNMNIEWKQLERGVLIKVNNHSIYTTDLVTLNDVWGEDSKDSVNFANSLSDISYYETENSKLLGFVLTSEPCAGLGCGINYQIIYDLQTKKANCFGRFRTGFDLELYNFDDNNKVDYLSKTFFGRNEQLRDTTLFIYFQRENDGTFILSRNAQGEAYYFKHMYSLESNTIPDSFEERWVKSIKNSR